MAASSSLAKDFFDFSNSMLVPGGSCHKNEVIKLFRSGVESKYRSKNQSITVTDTEIELLLKQWNERFPKAKVSDDGNVYEGFHIRKMAPQQQQKQPQPGVRTPEQEDMLRQQRVAMMEKMEQLRVSDPEKFEQVRKQQETIMEKMARMDPAQMAMMQKQKQQLQQVAAMAKMGQKVDPAKLEVMRQQQLALLQQQKASMNPEMLEKVAKIEKIQNDPLGRKYFPYFLAPDGGNPFETEGNRSGVQKVIVRCGLFVDAIQLVYKDGKTAQCGGPGGEPKEFVVPADDVINKVSIWSGWGTDAVQFHTKNGIDSPKFGGPGGQLRIEKTDDTCSCQLIGMKGRCSKMVDLVNFKFSAI